MLTPEQLNRLREVCVDAHELFFVTNNQAKENKATAALADIDAEIELLKGTS